MPPIMEFGYRVPQKSGTLYKFTPREYLPAMYRTLDIVTQGFSPIYVGDHLDCDDSYTLECWTFLTWIAAKYPEVKIGSLVVCNPFRNPALMAKMAASLQDLSAGNFVLGYGVGSHIISEYDGFGYPFPTPKVRVEMMEEAIQVIKTLWTDSPANFSGKYYSLSNAQVEPRPQPRPPILIGGGGEKLTLRAVARHADWWSCTMHDWRQAPHKLNVLKQHCESEGRDYSSIRKTFDPYIFIDKNHSKAIEASKGYEQQSIAGDPSAICYELEKQAELGFDLANLAFRSFPGTDDIELFLDKVIPHFS